MNHSWSRKDAECCGLGERQFRTRTKSREKELMLFTNILSKKNKKLLFHKKTQPSLETIFTGISFLNCFRFILLTLSWQRPLSYRNQSIALQSKSMDWLLYSKDLKEASSLIIKETEKLEYSSNTNQIAGILYFYNSVSVVLPFS